MSDFIIAEARFYLNAFMCGMILSAVYDILRILRRIIRHSELMVGLEDLFFWAAGGIFTFYIIFKYNSGKLRGPAILIVILGMLLYHYAISNPVVNFLTRYIIRPIQKMFRFCKKGLKKLVKRVKMILIRKNKKCG